MAKKYNLTGQQIGKLKVIRLLKMDERPTQNHGNYWLCQCDCGNMCKVPTAYLTGNGNYTQLSCGCDRKKKAFSATTNLNIENEYLAKFSSDFEKYLLLHKSLRTTNKDLNYFNLHLDEYKEFIDYFWNDEQFNKVYSFWKQREKINDTFYDWAKPSLDHIIPISRGGLDNLENYQFLTVFENLSKRDMTMQEWNVFKKNNHTASDYFIENIMQDRGEG